MTAPFQVTGQVGQSDTESSKHHHWNGNGRRQKCAILEKRNERTQNIEAKQKSAKQKQNQHLHIEEFGFAFV